jgi:tetratricopeptide (TPR) repeat protein
VSDARCLSADEIADAVAGRLRSQAQHHLTACSVCAKRVDLMRRVSAAGVEPVVGVVNEVAELTESLLNMPREQLWRTLRRPEYQQPHVIPRLVALANDSFYRNQELSLALITKAARVIEAIPEAADVAELRFETWKVAADIMREAGRFKDSEIALTRAERAARYTSNPERAEALALFYRVLLWAEPDVWRPVEAAKLLDRVHPVFDAWDERRRKALRTARGFLLYRSGDFNAARRVFEEILASVPGTSTDEYLHALQNVALVRVDLGDTSDDVERTVGDLIAAYHSGGKFVAMARAEWIMGRLLRHRGDYDESERVLRAAMERIGDRDSAIRVGLDRLQTLLLAGDHDFALNLAKALSLEASRLDREEPSRRRALTAEVLAYAREAAARGSLTADLMLDLVRYVDRINRQRPTAFVPPMPLAAM